MRVLEVTGTQHRTMIMRLDTPPYDNFDLRMALKLVVKRQEMIDKIESGHGVVGNDHNISPAQQYYNTELPQREYDPDKAKFHLKKAGMEGIELELIASPAALDGAANAAICCRHRPSRLVSMSRSSACRPMASGRISGTNREMA